MGKTSKKASSEPVKKMRPAITPEGRESQLISLATNLAEKQMMEGTASSQIITYYLKLGSEKEKLERLRLEYEVKKLDAQTKALQSAERMEELYKNAMEAMRSYSGNRDHDY